MCQQNNNSDPPFVQKHLWRLQIYGSEFLGVAYAEGENEHNSYAFKS